MNQLSLAERPGKPTQGKKMKPRVFRTTLFSLVLGTMLFSLPVSAQQSQSVEAQPGGGAMIADALVARPLLAAATIGGTALFIVSMPFSALGGNMEGAAETLVMTPARATFARCLGCTASRPPQEPSSSQSANRAP
ncbi:hypothetical protein [Halomonas campaniensis]|uniref:hypothetical protein n=1 Tax=Halomonas campaniensis TaxID=213554 RepID=UPI003561D5CA